MTTRIGKYTISLNQKPAIAGFGSAVGEKEGQGPLQEWFDNIYDDMHLGQKTWEAAESALMTSAISTAIFKSGTPKEDVNAIFAGDLLDQSIATTFGIKEFEIPVVGLYGACSTMALSLCMASLMVNSKIMDCAVAATSSHFCTAERQFRFPLEYGSKCTPTSQRTATASGAAVIKLDGDGPYINSVTLGKIVDFNITDANNMGAAMAPAARDTFNNFFFDTNTGPKDYDLILTGDLGSIGSELLYRLIEDDHPDFQSKHKDCGNLIYDPSDKSIIAGGSGCGCSAAVLCSYICDRMRTGHYKKVLFCGTGALLSPTSTQQGLSIPGIAHLVELTNTK